MSDELGEKLIVSALLMSPERATQTATEILGEAYEGKLKLEFGKHSKFIAATLFWIDKGREPDMPTYIYVDLGSSMGTWKRISGSEGIYFEGIETEDADLMTKTNTITIEQILQIES